MLGRVLLVHFSPPGVVGGVEHIMQQHADLLRDRGYHVDIVAGRQAETGLEVNVIPQLDVARAQSRVVEAELDKGVVSHRFYDARSAIHRQLAPLMEQSTTVIVHNAFTLHFNLALTSVLWEIAAVRAPDKIIAWSHDLSWTNPIYLPLLREGYPWDLLRFPAPGVRYVTVSEERKEELTHLWGRPEVRIDVVPNGVDVFRFLRLSRETGEIVHRYRLFDRDIVLLLPVRITRRKNIEAGIRAVRSLKDRGLDVRFLISGPQAPHHPGRSVEYLDELKSLRRELDLVDEVVFLAEDFGLNLAAQTVSELYSVADVLLFPSEQEGFGLPVIEAGLARVPVVLSDIPIFHEIGGGGVWHFDLHDAADTIAGSILEALGTKPAQLYRRVLSRYRWDVIVDGQIVPLLHTDGKQDAESTAGAV